MLMGKEKKTFRGGLIGCWRSKCVTSVVCDLDYVAQGTLISDNLWLMRLVLSLHARMGTYNLYIFFAGILCTLYLYIISKLRLFLILLWLICI